MFAEYEDESLSTCSEDEDDENEEDVKRNETDDGWEEEDADEDGHLSKLGPPVAFVSYGIQLRKEEQNKEKQLIWFVNIN